MKKYIGLFLLIIISSHSYSQSISNLDAKNGYKDLKFGVLKSELNSKIFQCTPDGHCLVKGDSYHKIKDIDVENVFMKFSEDGKLYAIILTVKGEGNVDKLLEIYKATYGTATGANKSEKSVDWVGKYVGLNFDIDIDASGNVTATIFISDLDLLDKNNQLEVQKNLGDL